MRGAVYARDKEFFMRYVNAMCGGMWEQALKMDEDDVIKSVVEAAQSSRQE